MSSSAYIEYQVRPPSAFDPAFLDEISESEMSTNMNNMKSGNGREDFLSSFGIEDVELDEHEQAMMQHQLQHQYRQAQQQQQQQYLQQQQQHYLPPSPARSSASTASLVSQRSAAAKRSTGAAPRSRAHSNNSVNKNNDNLRMPVSFDEETELLQEELGYDFVAGKDVLSGRGQKVKVLNTHYRDLIRKYHPEYVAAGFGGKRRKLAEAICSQIFSAGGRFLDFKGQPMTEQQCQQKIMKALKDFSKKGKSAAAAAAAAAAASGSTSSSAPKAKTESTTTRTSSPKPPTQTCSGSSSSKATRRNSIPGSAPITSSNNTTAGPHIVSPAQSVRNTVLPPTLKEQQREPSPTPTSSGTCLRAASPSTPSVLMLESDDEDGVVSSPTQVSSSNSSVVGSSNNNRYYFDPPPLASDVPYETAAAFRVEPSSPSSVRNTTMTPTSSVSDVGTPKRQKTMHNPPPPPPQYSYYQQHPHYHQYHQYPAQQYHHQQQQAYLPPPYTMVNRVTPVSLQPPAVARRVTLPMAAAPTRGGNVQHQFRAPSPPPFPSSGANSSSSNNSHHQRQHALFANSNDSRNNHNGGGGGGSGDIEPLPLTARLDMEDADACLQMLDDLVHPDDYP